MKKLFSLILLLPSLGFCDTKISNLPTTTTLAPADVIPVVTTPGSTPTNNIITFQNFQNNIVSTITASSLGVLTNSSATLTYVNKNQAASSTVLVSSGIAFGSPTNTVTQDTTSLQWQDKNQELYLNNSQSTGFFPDPQNIFLDNTSNGQTCISFNNSKKDDYFTPGAIPWQMCRSAAGSDVLIGAKDTTGGMLPIFDLWTNGGFPGGSSVTVGSPFILQAGETYAGASVISASQFLKTDASKTVISYDLFGDTPTYRGQASWTSASPSTFTALTVSRQLTSANVFVTTISANGNAGFSPSAVNVGSTLAMNAFLQMNSGNQIVFFDPTNASSFGMSSDSPLHLQVNAINGATFSNAVSVGSMTVTGSGNLSFTQNGNATSYQVVGSSTTPTNGHLAVWSSSWSLIDGGTGGGAGTPGGSSGQIQYNNGGSFGGAPSVVTASSITFTSSTSFTTNGAQNTTPGFVDVFDGSAYAGKPLFSVGSQNQNNQIVVKDQTKLGLNTYGAETGNLNAGISGAGDSISDANSAQQLINWWNAGALNIQTANAGDGGNTNNVINFKPNEVTELSVSSYTIAASTDVVITSSGSLPSLSLIAQGVYGTTNGTSGGFLMDCSGGGAASGMCGQVYSNAGAQSALDALWYIRANNSAWNEPLLYLSNANSSAQSTIRMDSGWPTFTMQDTTQSIGSAKKFQFSVHNGTLRFEGRNTTDSAFDSGIIVSSMASFGNVTIGQGYPTGTSSQFTVFGSTNNTYLDYKSTTSTSGIYAVAVTTANHISFSGILPSTSSCGTGAGFLGNDNAGRITPGGSAAGCTVTFATPWKNIPSCVVGEETFSLTNALSYTVSTTALTITETSLTSKLDYICHGISE